MLTIPRVRSACFIVAGSIGLACSDGTDASHENAPTLSGTSGEVASVATSGTDTASSTGGATTTTSAATTTGNGTGGAITTTDGGASIGGPITGAGGSGTMTSGGTTTGIGGAGQAGASSSSGGAAGSTTGGGANASGGTGAGGGTGDPVMSDGCGTTPTITSGNGRQLDVGGTTRSYNISIPDDYDNNTPHRLILGYHGASLSADIVTNEAYYGLLPLSDGNTIFVAPQGLPTGGPFGDGWSNSNGADVEFSRQLIAELEGDLCIDSSRIFAEGFSMGGSMAYAMACAAGDIIRAVAVHSGGPMSGCVAHDTPVAYFMTHGTVDDLCTYPEYGVPELQDFAQVNGCTNPNPGSTANDFEAGLPDPNNMDSACIEFDGCMDGYPVRSCLFVGGHIWNPGDGGSWVPAEVWEFFTQF